MQESGKSLHELTRDMPRYPQTMINVRTESRVEVHDSAEIQSAIRDIERRLADRGRVLVRASGTEPVVRVMVEGEDAAEVLLLAEELAGTIGKTTTG
jgi:phosphoglucosamine mutase